MSNHVLYEHNDDGDCLLTIQECRQQEEDPASAGRIEVSIDGRTCCLPPSQRQAAAQALAGNDYRVVPAKAATVDPETRDEFPRVRGTCPACGSTLPQWELRRAEPEPDPAAVEALSGLLEATWAAGGMGVAEQARLLLQRGVRVEVPDAECSPRSKRGNHDRQNTA